MQTKVLVATPAVWLEKVRSECSRFIKSSCQLGSIQTGALKKPSGVGGGDTLFMFEKTSPFLMYLYNVFKAI